MTRPGSFRRSDGGVSGIEFALILPMLAIIVIGLFNGWSLYRTYEQMREAATASQNYLLQGGNNDARMLDIANQVWSSRPSEASANVSRACLCNSAAIACTALCVATQSPPQTFVTIRLSGVWTDTLNIASKPVAVELTTRVR
jgi:Flp pilus assembly protein TadG